MTTERIEHPFSNSTEGFSWTNSWCDRCIHDHDENHGPDGVTGPGCMYLTHNLATGDAPIIWQPYGGPEWWRTLPAGIDCRAFEPCEHDCVEAEACRGNHRA